MSTNGSAAESDQTLIEVPLDPGAEAVLRRIVAEYPGVYGRTPEEACAYLIRRGVDDLIRSGALQERVEITGMDEAEAFDSMSMSIITGELPAVLAQRAPDAMRSAMESDFATDGYRRLVEESRRRGSA